MVQPLSLTSQAARLRRGSQDLGLVDIAEEPNSVLGNVLRFASRPGFAVRSLLRGEPVDAVENLAQMALDFPTGGFLDRRLSLANILPESVQAEGDITTRAERPEFSDVTRTFGIRPRGLARTATDLVGGILTDPLTFATLGGSGIAKGALSGVARHAAGGRIATALARRPAGRAALEAAEGLGQRRLGMAFGPHRPEDLRNAAALKVFEGHLQRAPGVTGMVDGIVERVGRERFYKGLKSSQAEWLTDNLGEGFRQMDPEQLLFDAAQAGAEPKLLRKLGRRFEGAMDTAEEAAGIAGQADRLPVVSAFKEQGDLMEAGIRALEDAKLIHADAALRLEVPFTELSTGPLVSNVWGRIASYTAPGLARRGLRAAGPTGRALDMVLEANIQQATDWAKKTFWRRSDAGSIEGSAGAQEATDRLAGEQTLAEKQWSIKVDELLGNDSLGGVEEGGKIRQILFDGVSEASDEAWEARNATRAGVGPALGRDEFTRLSKKQEKALMRDLEDARFVEHEAAGEIARLEGPQAIKHREDMMRRFGRQPRRKNVQGFPAKKVSGAQLFRGERLGPENLSDLGRATNLRAPNIFANLGAPEAHRVGDVLARIRSAAGALDQRVPRALRKSLDRTLKKALRLAEADPERFIAKWRQALEDPATAAAGANDILWVSTSKKTAQSYSGGRVGGSALPSEVVKLLDPRLGTGGASLYSLKGDLSALDLAKYKQGVMPASEFRRILVEAGATDDLVSRALADVRAHAARRGKPAPGERGPPGLAGDQVAVEGILRGPAAGEVADVLRNAGYDSVIHRGFGHGGQVDVAILDRGAITGVKEVAGRQAGRRAARPWGRPGLGGPSRVAGVAGVGVDPVSDLAASAGRRLAGARRAASDIEDVLQRRSPEGLRQRTAELTDTVQQRLEKKVIRDLHAAGLGQHQDAALKGLRGYLDEMRKIPAELENLDVWKASDGFAKNPFYVPFQATDEIAAFMAHGAHNKKFRKALRKALADRFTGKRHYPTTEDFIKRIRAIAAEHDVPIPRADISDPVGIMQNDLGALMAKRGWAHARTTMRVKLSKELEHRFGMRYNDQVDQYMQRQFAALGVRDNALQRILGGGVWKIRATDDLEAWAKGKDYVKLSEENGQRFLSMKMRGINHIFKPAMTILWPSFVSRNILSSFALGFWDPDIGMAGAQGFIQSIRDGMIINRLVGESHSARAQFLRAARGDEKALAAVENMRIGSLSGREVLEYAEQGILTGRSQSAMEVVGDLRDSVSGVGMDAFVRAEKALAGKAKVSSIPGSMLGGVQNLVQKAADVSSHVEDSFRLQAFIGLLKKGVDPRQAIDRVQKAYVNYDLTGSNTHRLLRDLLPFAQFQVGTTPIGLRAFGRRPRTFMPVARLQGSLQQPGSQSFLPPDVAEGVAIPIGEDSEGQSRFISGLGLPQESVLKNLGLIPTPGRGFRGLRSQALAQLQPALKRPLESATDTDFFFGGKFGTFRRAPRGLQAFEDITGIEATERFTTASGKEIREVPGWVNAWLLGATPLSRFNSELDRFLDKRTHWVQNFSQMATGVRMRTVDQKRQAKKYARRMLEEAERRGDVGLIERFFEREGREVDDRTRALLQLLNQRSQ